MQAGERVRVRVQGRLQTTSYTWTGVLLGTQKNDLRHLGGRSFLVVAEEHDEMHRIPIGDAKYTYESLGVYSTEELLTHKCQKIRDFMLLEIRSPYYTTKGQL